MLRIIDVDYIKEYELLLTFSDGSRKRVDLEPYLTGEVFGELLDKKNYPVRSHPRNHRVGKRG